MARSRHPLDHLDLTPAERRRLLVRLLAEVVLRLQDAAEEAPFLAEKDPQDSSVSGLASRPEQSVDVQGA